MTASGSISDAIVQCIDQIVHEHAHDGRSVSLRGEITRDAHAMMMSEPVAMTVAAQYPLLFILGTGTVVSGVPFDVVNVPGVVAWQIRITEIV